MRRLDLEAAQELLPEVRRLTQAAATRVEELIGRAQVMPEGAPERRALEEQGQGVVNRWAAEIRALGAEPKGLWLVDFDSGEGYYCWRHPEPALEYFHDYESGFAGRRKIPPPVLH